MEISRATYHHPIFRRYDPRHPVNLDPDPAFLNPEPLRLVRVEMRRRAPVGVGYLAGTLDRGPGTRAVTLLELERGAGDGRKEVGRYQAIESVVVRK